MYNDKIVLFNKHYNRMDSIWYPTALENVHLNMDKSALAAKYGADTQDSALLNIRYIVEDGRIMVGNKEWKPPIKWDRQDDDSRRNTFTFASGQNFDFFLFGEWEEADPVRDSDYGGNFYEHMLKNCDYVFAITSVGGPYSVIPHFEITGR